MQPSKSNTRLGRANSDNYTAPSKNAPCGAFLVRDKQLIPVQNQ